MTEILCRVDTATRSPVVFIADTVDYPAHTVSAWIKGDPQTVSLDYYHQTMPLSAADEEVLRQRYARNFNDSNVRVRHRLPRTVKVLENILAKPGRPKASSEPLTSIEKAQQPVEQPAPATHVPVATADNPTPQALFAAIEQMRVDQAKQFAAAYEMLNSAMANLPQAERRAGAKTRASRKQVIATAARKPAAKKIPTKL